MKCTVIIDECREEEIIIYAHQKNEIIDEIKAIATKEKTQIFGYSQGEIIKLDLKEIYCFFVENGKLYALTEKEKYLIKMRLYNLEEIIGNEFIKINQSSIANVNKVQKFDVSIGGTLKIIFKNGYSDYVSRRNIKLVKERFSFKV